MACCIFYPAALYNAVVGLPLLVAPGLTVAFLGVGPVSGPSFFVQASGLAVLLFGVMYAFAGRDPVRWRPLIPFGVAGKLAFVVLVWGHLVWLNDLGWLLPAVAVGDAGWSLLFLQFARRHARR